MAKKARCSVTSATSPGAPATRSISILRRTKSSATNPPQPSGLAPIGTAGSQRSNFHHVLRFALFPFQRFNVLTSSRKLLLILRRLQFCDLRHNLIRPLLIDFLQPPLGTRLRFRSQLLEHHRLSYLT